MLLLLAPREIALGPSEIFHRRRHSYNPFDKIMERRKLSDLFAALFSQSEKNMEKLVSPILLEYPTDCFFSSTSAMVNQEPNVRLQGPRQELETMSTWIQVLCTKSYYFEST